MLVCATRLFEERIYNCSLLSQSPSGTGDSNHKRISKIPGMASSEKVTEPPVTDDPLHVQVTVCTDPGHINNINVSPSPLPHTPDISVTVIVISVGTAHIANRVTLSVTVKGEPAVYLFPVPSALVFQLSSECPTFPNPG